MSIKNTLEKEAKKALLKKAAPKLVPLETPVAVGGGVGFKAKLAGLLATIAAVATMAAQFLG